MPDVEQQELLLAFVEEGYELLDESEPLLIELEATSNESGEVDYEVLNTIFRLYHSLKGGAGFLDLDTVGKVTHEAETLLDLFRKGKGSIEGDHIDLLNRSCDFLRNLLENIEVKFSDEGFAEQANAIIASLREKIAAITGEGSAATAQTGAELRREVAEDATSDQPEDEGAAEVPQLTITPEMVEQFVAESEDLLGETEEAFLALDKDSGNSEQLDGAFRSLHSFKGNAGFLGYADLEKLSHQAETILDKVRMGEIRGNSELFSLLLEIVDFLEDGVKQVARGEQPSIPAANGLVSLMQDAVKKFSSNTSAGPAEPTKEEVNDPKAEEATVVAEPEPPVKAVPAKESEPQAQPAAKSTAVQSAKTHEKPAPAGKAAAQRQSIRVDVDKLEILLDLVGELVIAEAMVAQNPDLVDLDVSLENFEKSSMHLNKITRDLQDVATKIRMVPLSASFRRMIRLVRDLARKTGKKVDFKIVGEHTEVDKTVIEQIADPLVHIIRNSIDHGIATPANRRELGKPEVGKLTLEAKYVGGEVWISVSDDGMGLNREMILRKAIEKGLVEGDGSALPNEEVWPLIFQPGFSTAAKVTDLSGRGVGMDVVRRNIENIRGKVDIKSTEGEGSEVILRIPLTLAIIDGMITRVGASRYIIPILAIKETLRANPDDITRTMDGQEIIRIRDGFYPVIRVHELYGTKSEYVNLPDGIIVVVESDGKRVCLFVDELIAQQQVVIKGLSEYVGKVSAISGCTILADGTVCLIVDIGGLIAATESGEKMIAGPTVVDEEMENVSA